MNTRSGRLPSRPGRASKKRFSRASEEPFYGLAQELTRRRVDSGEVSRLSSANADWNGLKAADALGERPIRGDRGMEKDPWIAVYLVEETLPTCLKHRPKGEGKPCWMRGRPSHADEKDCARTKVSNISSKVDHDPPLRAEE